MKPDIDSTFVVPVTVRPHRPLQKGVRQTTAHYIHAMKVFVPMGGADLDRQQFLGVHPRSFVLTVVRPPYIHTIMDLAREMPSLPGRGHISWLGAVKCYREGTGLKIFVPNQIWNPVGPEFEKTWKDVGTAYWWSRAASAEPFFLIDLPSIVKEQDATAANLS